MANVAAKPQQSDVVPVDDIEAVVQIIRLTQDRKMSWREDFDNKDLMLPHPTSHSIYTAHYHGYDYVLSNRNLLSKGSYSLFLEKDGRKVYQFEAEIPIQDLGRLVRVRTLGESGINEARRSLFEEPGA